MSEAYSGLAEGAGNVGKSLGDQSRKIVQKKYGDDYVKTFVPGWSDSQDSKPQGGTLETEQGPSEKKELRE